MVKEKTDEKPKKKKHKRGHGEGTISQRKDGRWEAKVTIGRTPEGKPKRVTYYGKSRQEVVDKLDDARQQLKNGTFVTPSKTTLGQWIDTWLEVYAKPNVKITSWELYKSLLGKHIKPTLGETCLKDLRPEPIQRLYNEKLNDGLSSASVGILHTVLSMALKQAVTNGLVIKNVAEVVKKPKQKKHEIQPLTIEETNRFLTAARGNIYFSAFLLEWGTGLRRGELLGLRWKDVDLDKGFITVQQNLVLTYTQGLQITAPKTERSRRTIPLPTEVIAELKSHRVRQAQKILLAGDKFNKKPDLVFCQDDGKPVTPKRLIKQFKKILTKAGLPDITFHDMRHTHATMLLALDQHPKIVQERLGHSSISMTLDTYSHILPGMQERVAAKLSTVLDLTEKPTKEAK